MAAVTDRIEAYLIEFERRLVRRTPAAPSIVEEAAEHLYETRDELVAAGRSAAEAERVAIDRFGDARTVARRFRRAWLPVTHEFGWLVATAMGAIGIAGLSAAAVRAVAGGTAGIAAADAEVSSRNLLRILVGFVGLALGELLYLRRRGRPVRPRSSIRTLGLAGLALGGVSCAALAVAAATSEAPQMPGRWLSLSVALVLGAHAYRRYSAGAPAAPA